MRRHQRTIKIAQRVSRSSARLVHQTPQVWSPKLSTLNEVLGCGGRHRAAPSSRLSSRSYGCHWPLFRSAALCLNAHQVVFVCFRVNPWIIVLSKHDPRNNTKSHETFCNRSDYSPSYAFCRVGKSSLRIFSMACITRLLFSTSSSDNIFGSATGVTCQDRPNLSLSHPHCDS